MAGKRIVASTTLVAFLAAGVGLPVPHPPDLSGEAYPCRGHACGCVNAEMCRTSCCCFPVAPKPTCCSAKKTEAPPDCGTSAPRDVDSGRARPVFRALSCLGITPIRVSLGVDLSPPASVSAALLPACAERITPLNPLGPPRASLEPPTPPPRA